MIRAEPPTRRRLAPARIGALALLVATSCADDEPSGSLRFHRLGRVEYNNSLRDLLGIDGRPADSFPVDPPSHGFDNNAASLAISPLLFELHERAIALAIDEALDPDGPARAGLVSCDLEGARAEACARAIVESFAPRAWRRPLSEDERAALDALVDDALAGGSAEEALALALQAILLSPNFLFRIERAAPTSEATPLSEHELAARLSYFLWSSTPDDALLAAADAGALADPERLELEVRRMLADPRASALVDGFGGQWLGFRALDDVFKDAYRFPAFDEALRASMAEETRRFFADFLARDRDVRELLTARDSFVDRRLAALYGLPDPGEGFVHVSLEGAPRQGVLTQAGTLAALAYPFTTSPARRGDFILDRLLCEPPPPAPAGVDIPLDPEATTKREVLAQHRQDPACASCHERIDPLGLAFETYDAIGQHRVEEHGLPIDVAGALPSGEGFADALELASLLAEDPAFTRCLVEQVMIYALGRGLESQDLAHVDALADALARRGYGTRELFVLVATSAPLRGRAPEGR